MAEIQGTKSLIVAEDLDLGEGAVEVPTQSGEPRQGSKINASHVPLKSDGAGAVVQADDVDGAIAELKGEVDTKAAAVDTYTKTEVDVALGGKSNTGHNHDDRYFTETEVATALGLKEDKASKGAAGGYAELDAQGKVPTTQIPDLAITRVRVVTNAAARKALTDVQEGDFVKESSTNLMYILGPGNPSQDSSWIQTTNDNTVVTVNGKTGPTVTLTPADLGAANAAGNAVQDFAANTMTMNVGILAAIMRLVVSTPNVVDVFLYDTSKDSDPTWIDRCRHLSWYNEPLNTATRGKTRKPPRFQAIIATTTAVTIYDATDPALPMWMVFNTGGLLRYDRITSVRMVNGVLYVGNNITDNSLGGMAIANFLADTGIHHFGKATFGERRLVGGLVNRNAALAAASTNTLPRHILDLVNAVALTVLPGAPIDPATGLPVPTVAVATGGGVSVIKHDGTVVSSADNNAFQSVAIIGGDLFYSSALTAAVRYARGIGSLAAGFSGSYYNSTTTPSLSIPAASGLISVASGGAKAIGTGTRLQILSENATIPNQGMVAYVTKDSFSGLLVGDIRRAWLANSSTADRSVKNKPLTQVGAVTASPVATGAELMGYSGFSASNYLEEPYSADLDFGTGDFAIFGWLKENPNTTNEAIFCRAAYSGSAFTGGGFMQAYVEPGGKIVFSVSDDSAATFDTVATPGPVDDGIFRLVCCIVRSGKIELWVDAAKITEGPIANANLGVSNSNASMRFGYRPGGSLPLTNGTLALWRISAYAPTPEQIRAIYEAERHLFTENAKALLGGTSNAVQALAHDPDTDQLYVGTTDGVSVFQGLRRVNYLKGAPMTSANVKAIGAARGAVLIGTGAEAYYSEPERNLRELYYQMT